MNEKWKNLSASSMRKAVFWLFTAAFLVAAIVSPDRAELLSGLEAAGATRKALEEYVSRCPEDQLELYDPLEHYDTLADRLN